MLKKISLSMFVLCFAFSLLIFWDAPCQAGWVKSYGGSGLESAFAVEQTSDSGYIVAGQTYLFWLRRCGRMALEARCRWGDYMAKDVWRNGI